MYWEPDFDFFSSALLYCSWARFSPFHPTAIIYYWRFPALSLFFRFLALWLYLTLPKGCHMCRLWGPSTPLSFSLSFDFLAQPSHFSSSAPFIVVLSPVSDFAQHRLTEKPVFRLSTQPTALFQDVWFFCIVLGWWLYQVIHLSYITKSQQW